MTWSKGLESLVCGLLNDVIRKGSVKFGLKCGAARCCVSRPAEGSTRSDGGTPGLTLTPVLIIRLEVTPLCPLLAETQPVLHFLPPPFSPLTKKWFERRVDTLPCTSQHACRWKCDTEHCIRTLSECDSAS